MKRILFKEETNLIARGHEVVIGETILFVSREDRNHFRRIKLLDQLLRPRAQSIAIILIRKTFEHEKAIAFVLFDVLR